MPPKGLIEIWISQESFMGQERAESVPHEINETQSMNILAELTGVEDDKHDKLTASQQGNLSVMVLTPRLDPHVSTLRPRALLSHVLVCSTGLPLQRNPGLWLAQRKGGLLWHVLLESRTKLELAFRSLIVESMQAQVRKMTI